MFGKEMSTGDFAKLCKVDKKTLFYYDEINLLFPCRRDEKGYRYYSSKEYHRMNTIKLFQSLGMSLKDISYLLNDSTLEERKETLLLEQKNTIRKLQEIKDAQKNINLLLERMEHFTSTGLDELFYETSDPIYLKTIPIAEQKGFRISFINYGFEYGIIYDLKDSGKHIRSIFIPATKKESNYIKDSGNYVCIYKIVENSNNSSLKDIESFLNMLKNQGVEFENQLFYEEYSTELLNISNDLDTCLVKMSVKIRD